MAGVPDPRATIHWKYLYVVQQGSTRERFLGRTETALGTDTWRSPEVSTWTAGSATA